MIQFDILLEKIGGAGKSQVLLFVLLAYFNISGGFNSIVTVFIAYSPDNRCSVPPIDNSTVFPNLTEGDILNYTTPFDAGKQEYETCMRYGYDLSVCDDDLDCVNQTYPPIKCDKGYHYDTSLFTQTVVTEFNLVCDRNYLNALSTSMFYAGMLIGSFLFGNMADRFGRKPTMIVSYAGMLGCMFGVTYSTSVEMYMAFRAGTAAFQ
uniref:Major facilitator superfamily (MFS) profile domain-containing protein n=1 Tax=Ciona intestinalis TaxID=7719 RepID=H2XZQ1_CIOIN